MTRWEDLAREWSVCRLFGISQGEPNRLELPIYELLGEVGTLVASPNTFVQMAAER
jgi:hypothetical protein